MSYNVCVLAAIVKMINYSSLTVEEHLLFFGQLKGMSYSEANASIPRLVGISLLP